jgi:hypothetical protein
MWGYESGILPSLGHLSRFQHKVLKWTELPTFAWKNFGPAPEIGTLSRAGVAELHDTLKVEVEFSKKSSCCGFQV